MRKIYKLALMGIVSLSGAISLNSCDNNSNARDSFSIKASGNEFELSSESVTVDFSLTSDSVLNNYDISEIKWKINDKEEEFVTSTSDDNFLNTKWSFDFSEVGNYKVTASIGTLSSKNQLDIVITKHNTEDVVKNLTNVLNLEGGLVLGKEYDIGILENDINKYSLQDVDGILKINANGKLEVIGIATGKLKFIYDGAVVLDTYFAVSHSLLCTNIKNELKQSGIIKSQADRVTNSMLKEVKSLDLSDELQNDIESTIGLKYLTELEEIDLSNNYVSDVSWLSSCTKLKRVDLSYNSIENFDSIVDNQQLEYLDISNNEVNNISKIKFMQSIKYLDLSNNDISDISDVSTSYGLESLFLNNNNLTTFKDKLSGLENLKELGVGNCNIPFTEIASLQYLDKLTYLDITNTNPNIDDICNLTNLKKLIISNCKLNTKSLDGLNGLASLEYLDMSNNQLDAETYNKSFDGNRLQNLNYLKIGGNEFINIPDLSSFTKLDTLDLTDSYNLLNLDGVESLPISSLIIDDCNSLSNDNLKEKIDSISGLKKLSICGAFNYIDRDSFDYLCNLVTKDIELRFIDDKYVDKNTIRNYKSSVFFSFEELANTFEDANKNISLNENSGCKEIILSLVNETKENSLKNKKFIIKNNLFKLSIFGNKYNTYNINFEVENRKQSSFTLNLYDFNNAISTGDGHAIETYDGSKVVLNACAGTNTIKGSNGVMYRDKNDHDLPDTTHPSSAFVGYDLKVNTKNGASISLIGGNGAKGVNDRTDGRGNSSSAWMGLDGDNGADAIICHDIELSGKNITICGGNGGNGGNTYNGTFGLDKHLNGRGGNGGNGITYSGTYLTNAISPSITGGNKGVQGSGNYSSSNGIDGKATYKTNK